MLPVVKKDMKFRSRCIYCWPTLALALLLLLVLLYTGRSTRHDNTSYYFLPKGDGKNWSPVELGRRDILVYIHVQKTGGSHFLSHLVSSTTLGGTPLCFKPSKEYRMKLRKKRDIVVCPFGSYTEENTQLPEMWLVSEKTYGWICGLHPFLMEMKNCIPQYLSTNYGPRERHFHYITLLRHPVLRYISEYLHVQRGATWYYEHICGSKVLGPNAMKPCYSGYYSGSSWDGLTLDKFMSCKTNWANNRQTMMLADLEASVDCFADSGLSRREMEERLLKSAKENLMEMSYFGISEYMYESGELFKYRFSVGLADPPKQKKMQFLHSSEMLYNIWTNRSLYNDIVHINRLDMQLYHFALELFSQRLSKLNITIDTIKLDREINTLKGIRKKSNQRKRSAAFS